MDGTAAGWPVCREAHARPCEKKTHPRLGRRFFDGKQTNDGCGSLVRRTPEIPMGAAEDGDLLSQGRLFEFHLPFPPPFSIHQTSQHACAPLPPTSGSRTLGIYGLFAQVS